MMDSLHKIITVIIADDHELFLDGLSMLITRSEHIKVLARAGNGSQLLEKFEEYMPALVLTDLRMPVMDGIAAIKRIRLQNKDTRIIALSSFDSDHLVVEALEAGANGYIVKNADRAEIIEAIETVMQHKPYYCKTTTTRLAKLIARSRFNPYKPSSKDLFNDIEKKIIHMVCDEIPSDEMANILFLSKRTIDGYRATILEKMDVKTPAGVAIYAVKNGLYEWEDK
ncbi:MAG: response regulator transcription factor [Bacteroidota bacterium]